MKDAKLMDRFALIILTPIGLVIEGLLLGTSSS